MENNKKKEKGDKGEHELSEEKNNEGEIPVENLSGEEILNKIDHDAESNSENKEEHHEGNDLLQRLGLSKKDKMKKENAELKLKVDELNDKYLRAYAEFDNFKKRSIKERIEFSKIASMDVIMSLLPVLDDFSRALKQEETSKNANALIDGVKLIQQKLNSVLEAKGLKQMKSIGEVFDAELHEAITEVPVEDENMKGKVVDEIECGYYLFDKIIRHAKVVVGK